MNRAVFASCFATAAAVLLIIYVVNHVGYSSVAALALFVAVLVVSLAIVGPTPTGAAGVVLVVYYGVHYLQNDYLVAVIILAVIAALLHLSTNPGRIWRG